VSYLNHCGYYSYLIKVCLGLGEDTRVVPVLFYLCLLGCQSLETLLRKLASHLSFERPMSLTADFFLLLLERDSHSATHLKHVFFSISIAKWIRFFLSSKPYKSWGLLLCHFYPGWIQLLWRMFDPYKIKTNVKAKNSLVIK